jgi:hypothetical protein
MGRLLGWASRPAATILFKHVLDARIFEHDFHPFFRTYPYAAFYHDAFSQHVPFSAS